MHVQSPNGAGEIDTTDLSTHTIESMCELRSTLVGLDLVEALPPLRIGDRSRYELIRVLGRGAMGTVYLAQDCELNRREVAVKVVAASSSQRGEFEQRLLREAWALARVDHPNVVHIYDISRTSSGELFIVMQYIAGPTLRQWASRQRRSRLELLEVFSAAGRGLQAAHDKNLIHRDFKPDNVLVRGPEQRLQVVVADFGLVGGLMPRTEGERQAGSSYVCLGTPDYMPPEQRHTSTLDPRSDQYAFCVSMWELLVGELPNFSNGQVLLPPRGRGIPRQLVRTLARGLAQEPVQRFSSMNNLLDELARSQGRIRALRRCD